MKRSILFTLLTLTVCLIFTGCGKSDEPTHEHTYTVTVTDPTDTERGYSTYLCECGESYISQGDFASEGITYEMNADGTGYIVTGIYNCPDNNIIIPSSYMGLPVVAIGEEAFRDSLISGISIPKTVSSIGTLSLATYLNLDEIRVSESSPYYKAVDGVLYSKDGSTLVRYPAGKDGTDFTVPEQVTAIANGAFALSLKLENVTLPSGVTYVGDYAFFGCEKLGSVILPDGVTAIGDSAFKSCDVLDKITIPASVKAIGSEAFFSCQKLSAVSIPAGVERIEDLTFSHCYNLKQVIIPDSVREIGISAFEWCDGMTSLMIGSGVESIGAYAFNSCKSLDEIYIPSSVASIGEWAFAFCDGLTALELTGGTENISDNAFYMCISLEEISIPEGVESIGERAFYGCSKLEKVFIPESVSSIGSAAFSSCRSLKSIKVAVGNLYFATAGGDLYSKNYSTLIQYAIGKEDEYFTVTSGVRAISTSAFSDCVNLIGVAFENPNGWPFSEEIMENPEKAAKYLVNASGDGEWTKG